MKSLTRSALSLFLLLASLAHAASVRLLESDEASRLARIQILRKARKTLRAMYFIVGDDETARRGLALAREAAKNNVEVRIIVDGFFNHVKPAMLRHLSDEGVHIRVYNPFRLRQLVGLRWLYRMHDKGLSIDGYLVQQGGRNAEAAYFGTDQVRPNYIDRDMEINSEAFAAQFDAHFDNLWRNADLVAETKFNNVTQKAVDKAKVELDESLARLNATYDEAKWASIDAKIKTFTLAKDPVLLHTDKESSVIRKLADRVMKATTSVFAETPYFVPTPELFDLFRKWEKEHVAARFLTNSPRSSDGVIAAGAYVNDREEIAKTGTEVWELNGPRALHSKTIVVDRKIVYNGTANADPRSLLSINSEIAVELESPELAEAVIATMNENIKNASLAAKDGKFYPENVKAVGKPVGWKRQLMYRCSLYLSRVPFVRNQI